MPHVLIVEKNEGVRALVAAVVEEMRWTSISFQKGDETLAYLRKKVASKLDLIVVTAYLGVEGMRGSDLIQKVRAEESFANIPIILMSGLGIGETQALALGANYFWDKMSGPFELQTTLEQAAKK